MTELAEKCIDKILINEGGYVNDPVDPGGETNFGISRRSFPDVDIKNLDVSTAKDIYYSTYWLPLKIEALVDHNAALQIFDHAVNAGITRAVKMAQQVAGVKVDGHMGIDTLAHINIMGNVFVQKYRERRITFYTNLVKVKPKLAKFLKGWINRVNHTKFET